MFNMRYATQHNLKSLTTISFYAALIHPHSVKLTENDFRELHLHNLNSLLAISFYTTLAQLDSYYIRKTWFQGSTPAQPEIFPRISLSTTLTQPVLNLYITLAQPVILPAILFYATVAQLDSHYIRKTWFQGFTPAQPDVFARISLYTTLAQPNFYDIRTTWFQSSTPAQPEIFVDDIIVHYIRTTWDL